MASTATAWQLQHTQAAREDVEMTLLRERLELLTNQRCLAAIRCKQFTDMMENALCESRAAGGEDCSQGSAHSPKGATGGSTSRRASLTSRSARRASFDLPTNRETAQYYGASSKSFASASSRGSAHGDAGSRGAHHHRSGRRGSLDIQSDVPRAHQWYPTATSEAGAHPQMTQLFQFKGFGARASGTPQAARAPEPRGEAHQFFEYSKLKQARTPAVMPAQPVQPAVYQAAPTVVAPMRAYQASDSEGDTSAPSDEEDFLRCSPRQPLPAACRRASLDLPVQRHAALTMRPAFPAFPQSASIQHPPVRHQQACFAPTAHAQQQQQKHLQACQGRRGQGGEGSATEDAETSEASDAEKFLGLPASRVGRRHSLDISMQRNQIPTQGTRMVTVPNRPCPAMAAALAAVSPEESSSDLDTDSSSDSGPGAYPISLRRRSSMEARRGGARLVADDFLTAWETPRAQWRRSSRQIMGQKVTAGFS